MAVQRSDLSSPVCVTTTINAAFTLSAVLTAADAMLSNLDDRDNARPPAPEPCLARVVKFAAENASPMFASLMKDD